MKHYKAQKEGLNISNKWRNYLILLQKKIVIRPFKIIKVIKALMKQIPTKAIKHIYHRA